MDTAHNSVLLFVPHVHSASFAVAVVAAFFTNSRFCPAAVAHYFKAVIPNILKTVFVNVSLNKMPVDIRAGGD